jgi:phosphate transport system protein
MKLATTKMLRDSLQAFNQEDSALAQAVCNDDNIVDNYNRQIISDLIMLMQKAPEKIQDYLHLMRISRNYERIADLSTNIAENTIYLAQGRVIKHNIDERLS